MHSANGGIHVVFNGEIYNHRKIRSELCQAGVTFDTHCDTEVILRVYERHGLDGFARFNGMFAIAVWDRHDDALHLVRDRLGVKPLYWQFRDGAPVFASELKAILAAAGRDALAADGRSEERRGGKEGGRTG